MIYWYRQYQTLQTKADLINSVEPAALSDSGPVRGAYIIHYPKCLGIMGFFPLASAREVVGARGLKKRPASDAFISHS